MVDLAYFSTSAKKFKDALRKIKNCISLKELPTYTELKQYMSATVRIIS
ncbi:MAG: hypothetical protein ACI9RO_000696 [Alteromonas macleodii]|jgi:hypothetical protein